MAVFGKGFRNQQTARQTFHLFIHVPPDNSGRFKWHKSEAQSTPNWRRAHSPKNDPLGLLWPTLVFLIHLQRHRPFNSQLNCSPFRIPLITFSNSMMQHCVIISTLRVERTSDMGMIGGSDGPTNVVDWIRSYRHGHGSRKACPRDLRHPSLKHPRCMS